MGSQSAVLFTQEMESHQDPALEAASTSGTTQNARSRQVVTLSWQLRPPVSPELTLITSHDHPETQHSNIEPTYVSCTVSLNQLEKLVTQPASIKHHFTASDDQHGDIKPTYTSCRISILSWQASSTISWRRATSTISRLPATSTATSSQSTPAARSQPEPPIWRTTRSGVSERLQLAFGKHATEYVGGFLAEETASPAASCKHGRGRSS